MDLPIVISIIAVGATIIISTIKGVSSIVKSVYAFFKRLENGIADAGNKVERMTEEIAYISKLLDDSGTAMKENRRLIEGHEVRIVVLEKR